MTSAPRENASPGSERLRLHRGPDRRTLLRGGLLAGLGAVGLITAAPLFTGTARADNFYSLDGDTYLCQQNWWYCHVCASLFYSASGAGTGACAGQTNQTAHSPLTPANGGDNYLMAHDHSNDKPSQVQVGWQWCDKCQGLYWGSAQSASMCAYDAMHHHTPAGTYVYDMPIAPLTTPQNQQTGWRYCGYCRALFFGHGGDTGGACIANDFGSGKHRPLPGIAVTDYGLMAV